MHAVDEGATAHVHTLVGVLLEDGHLPGVLAELGVAVHVDGVLDAAVDALCLAAAALRALRLRPVHGPLAGGPPAAHVARAAPAAGRARAETVAVVCLALRTSNRVSRLPSLSLVTPTVID